MILVQKYEKIDISIFQTREDTYYSRIVRDLQDKLNLVSSENIQLRDHFFKLQNDLMKCLRDRETQNGLGDADQVLIPYHFFAFKLQRFILNN
jgi:hypothetical protein